MATFLLMETGSDSGPPTKLTKAFSKSECTWIFYSPGEIPDLADESTVVTYLSDAAFAEVVTVATERRWALAVMPHPESRNLRIGFGISKNLDEAIEDYEQAESPIAVDFLRCNGQPVFNAVLIGEAAQWLLGIGGGLSWFDRLRRFVRESRRIGSQPPTAIDIETEKNKLLQTAALGIVIVEHGSNSLLSRRVLEESSIQDGMLHALILAPQSWVEMMGFFFETIVLHPSTARRLPPFAGHIKTGQLAISSERPFPYVIDGQSGTTDRLELAVEPETLRIYPGRYLEVSREAGKGKEVYRVQTLPSPQARRELVLKPLPYLRHAATDDFKELFQILRENARFSSAFITLMTLSTLLAVCGLFANSGPVIIGAMILAPLMGPIVSLAMGICRQEETLITRSLRTVAGGMLISLTCAAVAAMVLPLQLLTSEIEARLSPNLLDLGVAILSGIAGAYAHARQEIARSLAGVAIAVALVPPLVVAGIGVGWWNLGFFLGAFLLFVTNLVGLLFAASITFSLLGFSPLTRARRGVVASLLMVGVVSIPLSFSFARVVDSQRMIRTLEGFVVELSEAPFESVLIRDVSSRREDGQKVIRCQLVCPLSPALDATGEGQLDRVLNQVYRAIREQLGADVIIESVLSYRDGDSPQQPSGQTLSPDTPLP